MLTFTVNKTYEIITPESAEEGDAAERGYDLEDEAMDLRELMNELERCSELSDSHVHARTWATCYGSPDMHTGEYRNESIHISAINGKKPTTHQLKRLFKAAKLC